VALLERLEILIDADGKAARSEFESIGRSAEKELGRAEDRTAKMSARLQTIGTGALVGGAVAVGALGLLAKASDDADKQVLKLENSIKNSDQAFRNKGKALRDVAQDLQKVTAADADAVIGSQSLLVQFGLTERQITQLTPLIVDLSRKMGIDMDAAAKAVGKSVDGSAGALKKMGIVVDETAFATDSFQATFDALNQTVGGFARVEGKTFSGQLEILKNNVGDLGEAVGTGAAGVLGGLAGQAADAAGALNELNPGLLTAAGGLATTAGLVATVGGGFAVAAGKALEFKDTLAPIGATGEREFTRVGKAAAAVGGILAGIGIAETFVQVGNQINDIDQKLAAGTDKFRGSLSGTNAELGDSFARLVEVEDQTIKLSQLWEGVGAEVQLGNFAAEIEDVERAFDDALNSFGPDAAQRLVDNLKEQNKELSRNSDQYRTNATFIRESQKKIDERREATVEATVADKAATRAQDAAIKAEERRQVTIDSIKDSVEEYAEAISTLSLRQENNAKKASAFSDALEDTKNSDSAAVAATTLSSAMRELQDGISALPPELDIAGLALGKYSDEAQAAVEDLESFGASATGLLEQLIASGADDATVTAMADQLRAQLVDALTKAKVPPENFDEYIGLAGLDERQIRVALVFANKQEFLEEIRFALDIYQAELDAAPLTIKTRLQAKLDAGDLEGAKALIDTFTTVLSGNPVAIKAAFDTSPQLIGPILADLQYALSTGDLDIPTNLSFPPPYKSAEDYVAGIISQVAAGKPMLPIAGNLDPARSDVETYKGEVEGSEPPKLPIGADTEPADTGTNTWKKGLTDAPPVDVPVGANTLPARGAAAELFFDIGRLAPIIKVGLELAPGAAAGVGNAVRDGLGRIGGSINAGIMLGGADGDPSTPYPRKMGGPASPDNLYQVNETGRELFRPSTPGFVMNASDTDRLISGVEKLVAGSGSGVTVNQQIVTADPVVAGSESARKMRDAQFLAGV
jgi:plasmid stabilization system protein ParE